MTSRMDTTILEDSEIIIAHRSDTGKVTKVEGENSGVNKEKELFDVMVNHFPQELRDIYLSTVQEQVMRDNMSFLLTRGIQDFPVPPWSQG